MLHIESLKSKEVFPGFTGRFLHGEKSTTAFWDVKKGSSVPMHQHVHEQVTYIVEGDLEMTIGGEKMLLTAGAMHVIPSNTPHTATAKTDCKIIDVFVPVREDYRF
ncbi:MAG: cupin domain-containing protein [Bacteroidetes bacterium]|nr:MAG: cupin domain-containing protein [Bacteroidota bacterium]